jgi:hypothetical protein
MATLFVLHDTAQLLRSIMMIFTLLFVTIPVACNSKNTANWNKTMLQIQTLWKVETSFN